VIDIRNKHITVIFVGQSYESAGRIEEALSLENQDTTVVVEATAEDGLRTIATSQPDCILSTYELPDTNGINFFETVRDRHPALPFILFGNKVEAVTEAAIDAGVTDCIHQRNDRSQHRVVANRVENAVTRYRLQRKTNRRGEELQLFFDESPLGAIQWDDEFCVQQINEQGEKILGYTETELRGESWERIVAKEDRPQVSDAVSKLLAAEGGEHVVNKTVRADDKIRTVEWHNRAVTDATGDVRSIFSKFQDITEQVNRTLELEEYEAIIKAITDPIYVLDETGEFTFVNTELAELVGYDRETIIGSTPALFKNDEAIERAERELSRLLSSDGPETVSFEVTLQSHTGESIVCEEHMGLLPYTGESFNGSVGTLRNITDRKQQKQQLQNERDRLQAIFEDAFDAIVIFDNNGQYTKVNEQAAALFGLSKSELIGKTFADFAVEGFDLEATLNEIRQTQQERDIITLVRPDGTERLIEYSASANIISGQHLAVLRDITDKRQRERRFQALAEEANDIISIVDANGRFQYQSPSLERILGYEPEATVGKKLWEYIHPGDRQRVSEEFETWTDNSDQVLNGIEYRAQHADGSWRWMEAHGNGQVDNPAVGGYVINSRDITDRKERQQQLELVDRVLRHNVRNDMNVIRGKAQILQSNTTGENAEAAMQIIKRSNNLIDTAETERKMARLLTESADLTAITVSPLLQQVTTGIKADYPEASVSISCPDDVVIRATPQFRQAIEELLTNAIVHNPDDSPEARISVAEDVDTVYIKIADTGPLIPAMERDVLLGNKQRTELNHGSGLGLWFVQLLVSRSGGSIQFEPNSPSGNVVTLELPTNDWDVTSQSADIEFNGISTNEH
jgi:PAS domain S-box-containing protein